MKRLPLSKAIAMIVAVLMAAQLIPVLATGSFAQPDGDLAKKAYYDFLSNNNWVAAYNNGDNYKVMGVFDLGNDGVPEVSVIYKGEGWADYTTGLLCYRGGRLISDLVSIDGTDEDMCEFIEYVNEAEGTIMTGRSRGKNIVGYYKVDSEGNMKEIRYFPVCYFGEDERYNDDEAYYNSVMANMKEVEYVPINKTTLEEYFGTDAVIYSGYCGVDGDNVKWAFDPATGVLTITGTGDMDNFKSADSPWYDHRSSITSAVIGDGVTGIGAMAFYGCTKLTDVSVPESVTGISYEAFCGCTGLMSVTVPDGATGIGRSAFYNTGIYNDGSNWENGLLYIGNHLIEAKGSFSGDCTVEPGTRCIADYAFAGCGGLTGVTVPTSVTSIGLNAFTACTSLKTTHYQGSIVDWADIAIADGNDPLINAEMVFDLYAPPVTDRVDYCKLYSPVVEMFGQIMAEGLDLDYEGEEDILDHDSLGGLIKYDEGKRNIGFALIDVDGDGTPELWISNEEAQKLNTGIIFEMYTIVDGEVVHTISSGERSRYYYTGGNTFHFEGSASAFNSVSELVRLENGDFVKSVVLLLDQTLAGGPYFYGTDEENITPISEEEYKGIFDSFPDDVVLELKPLGKFPEEMPPVNEFSDVPDDSWFTEGVLYCNAKGYMAGVGNGRFAPGATLTRAMFVTILAVIDDADVLPYTDTPFDDVPAGKWYSKPVAWAYANGYASGTGNGNFSPNSDITRETLATFFRTYSEKKGRDVTGTADLSKYTDEAQISAWAKNAVSWAVASGLISGTSATTVSPKSTATRAQVALIVMNYVENIAG